MNPSRPLRLLLLLSPLLTLASAATFTCTTPTPCRSLLGYTPPNSTTLSSLKSLFQLHSLRPLLAANSLPLSTPASHPLPPLRPVRVPIPCHCSPAASTRSRRPLYTVKPGDGLDAIARNVFNGFVTYQEIAKANNISDPDKIEAGQRLWIPLPCSCDEVGGRSVVHYGHVVAAGSSVAGIAAEFGVAEEVLTRVNGIKDPRELQAGQILDVPLRACSSSISNTSPDSDLIVPNGSYALTANNCVICICSSPSWQLECHPTQGIASVCPVAKCGSLYIGNTSSISGCQSSTCVYAGYTNSTILTNVTTQELCNNAASPLSQPTNGSTPRLVSQGLGWMELLIFLQLALLCSHFL